MPEYDLDALLLASACTSTTGDDWESTAVASQRNESDAEDGPQRFTLPGYAADNPRNRRLLDELDAMIGLQSATPLVFRL